MKRGIIYFCLVAVGLSVLTETASAQILFKRRWQRRKAEIRSEVYHQVSNELTAKMDSVKGQLKQAAEEQIASEADKLTNQVQSELAKLHEETQKLVAAEAEKMQQEALAQIKKLREEAQAQVTEEAERLDEQLKVQVAKIGEDNKQQMEAAVAKAATTIERFRETLSEQVSAEVEKQTTGLKDEVVAEIKSGGKPGRGARQGRSDPSSAEPPVDTGKAIPPKPVKPVDEEAAGDAEGQ